MTKHTTHREHGIRTETIERNNGDKVETKYEINPTGFDKQISKTETRGSVPSDKSSGKKK